jgi:hypothetical protein
MGLVVDGMSPGSEVIPMAQVHLGKEIAMATDLRTEDGGRKTTTTRIVAIRTTEVTDGGIGMNGMSLNLHGWTSLLKRRVKLIHKKISRNGKKNSRIRTEVARLQLRKF